LDATDNFKHLIEIKALSALPVFEAGSHGRVSIVSSKSSEDVYITDAVNNQLVVVNLEHQELEEPISLPFTPKHVAWVGIAGEGHDHEH
jgi:predicted nucleotidyltransferase